MKAAPYVHSVRNLNNDLILKTPFDDRLLYFLSTTANLDNQQM